MVVADSSSRPQFKAALEAEKITQIDIRRKGARVVVDVTMAGDLGTRRHTFDNYESAVRFTEALWLERRRSIERPTQN